MLAQYPGLPKEKAQYLVERAVTPAVAAARGYKYVRQGKPLDGGYASAWGYPQKYSGLLIPLHSIMQVDATILRLDTERIDRRGKKHKFDNPRGQKNALATSPLTRDLLTQQGQVLFLVEGVTRIDALAGYAIPASGFQGIWNWKSSGTVLPDFDVLAIKGNRIILIPDGDVRLKFDIKAGVERLTNFLRGRGAESVHVVALPDGLGLDDWLYQQKFPTSAEVLFALRDLVTHNFSIVPQPSTDPLFDVDHGPWATSNLADARRLLEYAPERLCVVRTDGHWRLMVEGPGGRWRADDGALAEVFAECSLAWQSKITEAAINRKLSEADAKKATAHAVKAGLPRIRAELLGGLAAIYGMLKERGLLPKDLTIARVEALDANRLSLGAPNGVVDLLTGELMPPAEARNRLVTRSIPDDYNPTATHPAADQLINHLSKELQKYLTGAIGFSLRGNPAKRIYGLAGETNGGKSTALAAIHAALGDVKANGYGMNLEVETLLRTRWTPGKNAHQGNLFGLQDARIVVTEEPGAGTRFDVSILKRISGGDYFSLRDVGEKSGPARPIPATLFIALNPGQEASLDTSDGAIADRVRLLPYPKITSTLDRDRLDSVKYNPEIRQAVMAKMVRWAAEATQRPADPPSVREYTEQRRLESIGPLGQLLQTRLQVTGQRTRDRVYLAELWETQAKELGRDDTGRVDGLTYKQMLALARELHPTLPRTTNGGKMGMVWPGVQLLPAFAPCSLCEKETAQGDLEDPDGRGGACPSCREPDHDYPGDDNQSPPQFPLVDALETSLEFQSAQDRDLHFQWTSAGNLFGEPEPALVSQRQVGLRSLLTAVRANPRIADIPEEQLAVYGGPTAMAMTIGAAIEMVDKACWAEIEGSLDWPAFLLNVRGRAISLIEKEPDRRQTEKEAMVGMLQQPRLLPSPLAGH